MAADIDHPPLVHDHDAVGLLNRRQAVGDDQGGALVHQPVERLLHGKLALGIEGAGRLVEQQDGGIAEQRPGDGDALALAARQPHAARPEMGGEALRQGLDEGQRRGRLGRPTDLGVGGIGPGEIEECLMKHPAVAMVGVVGVPDKLRTEIVKAFVQLRPEIAATEALKADLAGFVKVRLAAHEYPREVEFVAELPLTTTGKIMRRELRRLDAERKAGR